MRQSTMLPVLMVIVIGFLTLIAISSGRSNAPEIAGDATYPHFVCTTSTYCEGETCTRDPISFVVYLAHEDGLARLELQGFSPRATLTEIRDGLVFESTGGRVSGRVTIFKDRGIDITATSGTGADLQEHYASGQCDRLIEP